MSNANADISITRISFPMLHHACNLIRLDNNGGHGHKSYYIPGAKADELKWAESALFFLTLDDLDTFCTGEDSERAEIAARKPGLRTADRLLNTFFEIGRDCCDPDAIAAGDVSRPQVAQSAVGQTR